MNIESQFKISAAIGYHEKKRNKINKYIIVNKDNDAVLINAAITIAEDERNVMDKYNMTGGRWVTIIETKTDTHKNKPTIFQRTYIGMHSAQQPPIAPTA